MIMQGYIRLLFIEILIWYELYLKLGKIISLPNLQNLGTGNALILK